MMTPNNIIWLSGMPRSGTTWVSQIFASSPDVRLKFCPLFSYEFKNKLDETATEKEWENLFLEVYNCSSEYLDQEYLRKKGLVPTFKEKKAQPPNLVIKSTRFHNLVPSILAAHNTIKFIHLVRDPRASIYSWLTNPHEFPRDADALKEWRSGSCRKNGSGEFWGFDDWKLVNSQALNLQAQYPSRFLIMQYEDLTLNPQLGVSKMFNFCNLSFHPQTLEFLSSSTSTHNDSKRSVYKKQTSKPSWVGNLDKEISATCRMEVEKTVMAQFLRD